MPQIYETFWKVDGIAVFNPLAKANGNETILTQGLCLISFRLRLKIFNPFAKAIDNGTILTQGLRLIFFSAKSEYF